MAERSIAPQTQPRSPVPHPTFSTGHPSGTSNNKLNPKETRDHHSARIRDIIPPPPLLLLPANKTPIIYNPGSNVEVKKILYLILPDRYITSNYIDLQNGCPTINTPPIRIRDPLHTA